MRISSVLTLPSALSLFVTSISLIVVTGCSVGGPGIAGARNPLGQGPAPVGLSSATMDPVTSNDLGAAGAYVILAKTGISSVPGSAVVGHIGVSPVAATYITGFSLVADATNVFATSSSVTGKVYAADYAVPTPSNLTTAIGSMETAYTDAAGRTLPDFVELGSGNIGGKVLTPGLYKWSSSVTIPTDVIITGNANDTWIFQIAGNLSIAAAQRVTLAGGAQAKNIFWQVAGQVSVGTTAHFEGIILAKTAVNFLTSSSLNGRIFSQTMVSLDHSNITQP